MPIDSLLSTNEIPGVASWVSFSPDGTYRGEGPCNDFRGLFARDADTVQVHSGTMTAGGCPQSEDGPDIEIASAIEELVLSPYISDTMFELTVADGRLLLSTEALALVYDEVRP